MRLGRRLRLTSVDFLGENNRNPTAEFGLPGQDNQLRRLRLVLLGLPSCFHGQVCPVWSGPFSQPKLILLTVVVPVGVLACRPQLKKV